MSKIRMQKEQAVSEIKDMLEKSSSVVIVNYSGLDVDKATKVRSNFREQGATYKVLKNRLFKRAVEGTEFESLAEYLEGQNAFAFGLDDPITPVKILSDFNKEKEDTFKIIAGVIEGNFCDSEKMDQIAKIPSREELLAKFLGSINSPLSNFVYLLSNISDKKAEGEQTPANEEVKEESTPESVVEEVKEESAPQETVEEVKEESDDSEKNE